MAALIALIILLSLGTWQAQKVAPKTALLERIHEGLSYAPVELPNHVDDPVSLEYHRVFFSGTIAKEPIKVFGINLEGKPGYFIYAPVERPHGMAIIVNFGWIPQEYEGEVDLPEGEFNITGVVRQSALRGSLEPMNDPRKDQWFTADVFQIATVYGYHTKEFYHFRIFADHLGEPGALPIGGQVRVDIPNNHFQYMLTWYGIALALIGVYVALGITRAKQLQSAKSKAEAK